jgi:hypothetical protein
MTYKVFCKCKHEFQDKTYGTNVRIANPRAGKKPDGTVDVRCTVCNVVHTIKG